MLLDERSELADSTALNTGAAGTYNIGDVIDRNLTPPEAYLVVRMSTAATSGGAATLAIRVVSDDTSTPSTTTATVHFTSGAIPVASLTAGALVAAVKLGGVRPEPERYIGIQQITGTAAFTGGSIDAYFTTDPSLTRPYADNVA